MVLKFKKNVKQKKVWEPLPQTIPFPTTFVRTLKNLILNYILTKLSNFMKVMMLFT